jgi:hypothetical protein
MQDCVCFYYKKLNAVALLQYYSDLIHKLKFINLIFSTFYLI